jgi:hypothetical protein
LSHRDQTVARLEAADNGRFRYRVISERLTANGPEIARPVLAKNRQSATRLNCGHFR